MSATNKIKILVVDDSFFMRKLISDLLDADPLIEVIATAKNGTEALDLIKKEEPEVVTLDYQMPGLDGLATLKKIMQECPVPVVMLSAYTKKGGDVTLECLRYGAVDFILKPSGPLSLDINKIKIELLAKVKAAAQVNLEALKVIIKRTPARFLGKAPKVTVPERVVVIGASTGGPAVLELILAELPKDIPSGILIAQHMPPGFTKLFAARLNKKTKIEVKEAATGDIVKAGLALIVPGDKDMVVEKKEVSGVGRAVISLVSPQPVHPSINILMESAAEVYGPNIIGVLLTGMGDDGVKGAGIIKKRGGIILVQDEDTSIVFGIPKRAIEEGIVDKVLPINSMSREILKNLR